MRYLVHYFIAHIANMCDNILYRDFVGGPNQLVGYG